MSRAIDVANYLIALRDRDEKNGTYHTLTNLKLQKLLYYCQVAHYRWDNQRLITDAAFEAWTYGPTIWKVYQVFSKFGQIDVQAPIKNRRLKQRLSAGEMATVQCVWEQLRSKSAFELADRSQLDYPYLSARQEGRLFLKEEDFEKKDPATV